MTKGHLTVLVVLLAVCSMSLLGCAPKEGTSGGGSGAPASSTTTTGNE
jgi:type IV pilus biogenesis protein CpaD/CtpE